MLLSTWLDRHRRIALFGLLILWGGTFALAWHEHRPRALFSRTFDVETHHAYAREANGLAAWLPDSEEFTDDGVTLIVALHHERRFRHPRIRISRGFLTEGHQGRMVGIAAAGNTLSELSEEQTRAALRSGLSDELLKELLGLNAKGSLSNPMLRLFQDDSGSTAPLPQ